jgi:hypothetical protein
MALSTGLSTLFCLKYGINIFIYNLKTYYQTLNYAYFAFISVIKDNPAMLTHKLNSAILEICQNPLRPIGYAYDFPTGQN